MTEPIAYRKPGHLWVPWRYDHARRRWYRHCTRTCCTAIESAARGHKPKTSRGSK